MPYIWVTSTDGGMLNESYLGCVRLREGPWVCKCFCGEQWIWNGGNKQNGQITRRRNRITKSKHCKREREKRFKFIRDTNT